MHPVPESFSDTYDLIYRTTQHRSTYMRNAHALGAAKKSPLSPVSGGWQAFCCI